MKLTSRFFYFFLFILIVIYLSPILEQQKIPLVLINRFLLYPGPV